MRLPKRVALLLVLALPFASLGWARGEKGSTQSLSLEGAGWSLLIDLPRFRVDAKETRPDGSGTMIRGSSRKTGLVVSAFLERVPASFGSASDCKEHYWSRTSQSPLPKSDVEHSSNAAMEVVEYMVEEFQGLSVMQKNVNAYSYRDGVCIDLHVSKIGFEATDDSLFTGVLESVRYSDE